MSNTFASPTTNKKPSAQLASTPSNTAIRIQPTRYRKRDLVIDMPIGTRLVLGFLVAALIAAIASGAIGIMHAHTASQQSDFYKDLLQTNTQLTTGSQYLQVMRSQINTIIQDMEAQQQSQETLAQDKQSLQNLIKLYNTQVIPYINQNALSKHPDQLSILNAAGRSYQVQSQASLISSVQRTWSVYQTSLNDINSDFNANNIEQAKYLQQVQVDPTNSDALSALRSLTQFNSNLAESIDLAAQAETQQEIITSIISSVVAFILVILVGIFISGTIIRRLRLLRQVTQAVEQGQLDRRVEVIGRDEIADVSASVNAMLDTMVGLLDETRNQRDALTNAASHLFTNMRVVSAGDLRVNAPVSNDPIGMLANAFNFTVGRFRRFAQSVRGTAEQLDVIAYQQAEKAESFTQNVLYLRNTIDKRAATERTGSLARDLAGRTEGQILQEIIKQSTIFASDVHSNAHQLSVLSQGIRTSTVNFQIDAADNNTEQAGTSNFDLSTEGFSNPGVTPLPQTPSYPLSQQGFSNPGIAPLPQTPSYPMQQGTSNPGIAPLQQSYPAPAPNQPVFPVSQRPKLSQTRLSSLQDDPRRTSQSNPSNPSNPALPPMSRRRN